MTNLFLILLFVFTTFFHCLCQVQEFYVKPSQTDAGYAAQDSHFVAYNATTQLNKLLLFIGGTFSSPKQYDYFCSHAAGSGFDAISLCYPNTVLTTLLAGSSDSASFDKFRQEICLGTQVSSAVSVDSLNSIYTRALKLIQHLALTYPSQGWNQYLETPTTLDWSKIIVSGHSQGAGHACYLAKSFPAERVIMFSGPNDYSTYFNNSAPWLGQAGITPVNRHFAFLHLQDEIVPFNYQFANITGLGMLQSDDTTLVENTVAPYSNSHCLYSKLPPNVSGQYHGSTVIYSSTPRDGNGEPVFAPVWNYMLSASVTTAISNTTFEARNFNAYPNPATSAITIDFVNSDFTEVFILNSYGQTVISENIFAQKTQIDLSVLPPGIYFILSNGKTVSFVKD